MSFYYQKGLWAKKFDNISFVKVSDWTIVHLYESDSGWLRSRWWPEIKQHDPEVKLCKFLGHGVADVATSASQ